MKNLLELLLNLKIEVRNLFFLERAEDNSFKIC